MFCLSPDRWFYRQGGLKNPPDSFSEETWRVWTWSRFWDDFFLENRKCLPRKWRNITWKGTISKGKACLPTIIFQGIFVSFRGSTKNVPLRMCISYLKMFVLHCRVSFRRCLISFFSNTKRSTEQIDCDSWLRYDWLALSHRRITISLKLRRL